MAGGGVQRRKAAAALSAAVTTTKLHETAPNAQAEPTMQKRPAPNASRSSGERVWGRGASLREAASPPASPSKSRKGRGGSVSRRDHNSAYRRHAPLTGGTN